VLAEPTKIEMLNGAAQVKEDKGWALNLCGLRLEGSYEIIRRIGAGSYAEVFLARNLSELHDEHDVVAVKALNTRMRGDIESDLEQTLIDNFALEARTMMGFDHPNIVCVFGCGAGADLDYIPFYYLILEYMPGGSLSQLCRSQPLSLEQTQRYAKQICSALYFAHSHGVLHRDVKPGNIMLSADRRTAKLLDFGTARRLDARGAITIVGTDVYAAPEHYSLSDVPRDELKPTADVYALAKTTYYMLCGESPSSFKQGQVTSLPAVQASHPWAGAVLQALRRATSSNPADRHQTVWDFYEELCGASEATTHTTRPQNYGPYGQHRGRSRIVVDVTPEQHRRYRPELKSLYSRCADKVRSFSAATCDCCGSAWLLLRPLVRKGLVAVGWDCRRTWAHLISLRRTLGVRVATVVIASALVLAITPLILRWWKSIAPAGAHAPGTLNQSDDTTAFTLTDVNVRYGPSGKTMKVGLAEKGSRLRVVSFSEDRNWCDVEIIEHGREKEDKTSADRGWVAKRYLSFNR